MGACVLVLAVEGSIKQSQRGGALCAQANIFERVIRIVKVCALLHIGTSLTCFIGLVFRDSFARLIEEKFTVSQYSCAHLKSELSIQCLC